MQRLLISQNGSGSKICLGEHLSPGADGLLGEVADRLMPPGDLAEQGSTGGGGVDEETFWATLPPARKSGSSECHMGDLEPE